MMADNKMTRKEKMEKYIKSKSNTQNVETDTDDQLQHKDLGRCPKIMINNVSSALKPFKETQISDSRYDIKTTSNYSGSIIPSISKSTIRQNSILKPSTKRLRMSNRSLMSKQETPLIYNSVNISNKKLPIIQSRKSSQSKLQIDLEIMPHRRQQRNSRNLNTLNLTSLNQNKKIHDFRQNVSWDTNFMKTIKRENVQFGKNIQKFQKKLTPQVIKRHKRYNKVLSLNPHKFLENSTDFDDLLPAGRALARYANEERVHSPMRSTMVKYNEMAAIRGSRSPQSRQAMKRSISSKFLKYKTIIEEQNKFTSLRNQINYRRGIIQDWKIKCPSIDIDFSFVLEAPLDKIETIFQDHQQQKKKDDAAILIQKHYRIHLEKKRVFQEKLDKFYKKVCANKIKRAYLKSVSNAKFKILQEKSAIMVQKYLRGKLNNFKFEKARCDIILKMSHEFFKIMKKHLEKDQANLIAKNIKKHLRIKKIKEEILRKHLSKKKAIESKVKKYIIKNFKKDQDLKDEQARLHRLKLLKQREEDQQKILERIHQKNKEKENIEKKQSNISLQNIEKKED